jgi:hypothetical protein
MKTTYTVSFDLADAQAFIPSGRINNLKRNLDWDKHVLTDKEIQDAISHNLYEKFQLNLDYDQQVNNSCEKYLANKSLQTTRFERYNSLGKEQMNRKEFFGEQIHLLTEEMREELPEIFESLKSHPEIEKRMNKLNQLKMLNGEPNTPSPKMSM